MADNFVQNLLSEKKSLQAQIAALSRQIAAIDELLNARGYAPADREVLGTAHHAGGSAKPTITKAGAIKRALAKAGHPVQPKDLPALMESEGYVFGGRNKLKALDHVLYGAKKLPFLLKTQAGLTLKK